MHETKYQQCLSFVLSFGVFKLLITLNSLRAHSVPNSIILVYHTLADVYDPLLNHEAFYYKIATPPFGICIEEHSTVVNYRPMLKCDELC
jgi:hypothetical protein